MLIPYDLSAFKVLVKKIFPPKESVFTVDTTGDGKTDSIQIKILNLIVPFVVPEEIEIGDFNLRNFDINNLKLSEYGEFFLDDKPINLSKDNINIDTIQNRVLIYHKGESFNLNEILEGKFSGRTIALGDSISIFLKLNENSLEMFTEGKHVFRIESDLISNFEIIFELDDNNMNIKFDPENA